MSKVLEIENFSKIYDSEKKAVNNISLSVEEGEIYGFIGHNGAGNPPLLNQSWEFFRFGKEISVSWESL